VELPALCGEEFSERRGTALFNTKLPELKAEEVLNHLGEGCSVRVVRFGSVINFEIELLLIDQRILSDSFS
jgi:hypothetical protein